MNAKHVQAQPGGLRRQLESIWADQTLHWDRLRKGHASLKDARIRTFDLNGSIMKAKNITARLQSSRSTIDPGRIARRQCLLCQEALPPEQYGVVYRDAWLFLCNPAPITDPHFVLNALAHTPQRIGPALEIMVGVAEELAGHYLVTYNGPVAGASIPEHLHAQVLPMGALPFEAELADAVGRPGHDVHGWLTWLQETPAAIGVTDAAHRSAVIVSDSERKEFVAALLWVVDCLNAVIPETPEPKLNLFVMLTEGRYVAWLFPRTVRRPSCYGMGKDDFLISPGTVDMAGLLMVPRPADFEGLTPELVRRIFREVILSDTQMAQLRRVFEERKSLLWVG